MSGERERRGGAGSPAPQARDAVRTERIAPRLEPPAPSGVGAGHGRLFVVATPIGNLSDLSPRAAEILASVDAVLAEDTRRVRKILNHFGIATTARSFHEHNEIRELPRTLAWLRGGGSLALASDAGTPLLADPGFRLVRACREEGIAVFAVAGPSAVTAALSVAGLPPYPFTFAGFLPAAGGPRARMLAGLAALPHTLVFFLSPHRLAAELAACAEQLGAEREAVVLVELTKLHERCRRGALSELADWAAGHPSPGEHTLVVGPPRAAAAAVVDAGAARRALDAALASGASLPEARRQAARALGITRRELYRLLTGSGR